MEVKLQNQQQAMILQNHPVYQLGSDDQQQAH